MTRDRSNGNCWVRLGTWRTQVSIGSRTLRPYPVSRIFACLFFFFSCLQQLIYFRRTFLTWYRHGYHMLSLCP